MNRSNINNIITRENNKFELASKFTPTGDQPKAVETLVNGIEKGAREQTLLGVTGSGKTFTMANIIAKLNRPALILAHNKTLAAQLCAEFREFFPNNAVEYFVSYYDYYQPEAYLPGRDIYIEKDSAVNDEIDKLRHSATSSLLSRSDVIIVSSVSCIYGLGDPSEYQNLVVGIRTGMKITREEFISRLVDINYNRNDINLDRNNFRVRGDIVEIISSDSNDRATRVEFFGDEIDRISEINIITGEVFEFLRYKAIFPASHFVVSKEKIETAIAEIEEELEERIQYFEENNKLIEAQRIAERTRYDIEMIREIGYCSGIENYSRIFTGRPLGATPYTLMDYFPDNYIMFIDESHVSVPQVRGMSGGDKARKRNLVDYGFRLPSAYDNRPLNFDEFLLKQNQVIYVSATPAAFERERSALIAEQVIRPTGLLDPEVEVRKTDGQIDDLIGEINKRVSQKERVIVTTLTKKMAEDLSEYIENLGIKSRYIHHQVDTIERIELLRDLRNGEYDVIIGINLLREGLDLPEVSLIAILDADKEGFLRSETSLIQIIGRAARNINGKVIMYADNITGSMERAINETNRRRKIQKEYNDKNGVTPQTIIKAVHDMIDLKEKEGKASGKSASKAKKLEDKLENSAALSKKDKDKLISDLSSEMQKAAKNLDFERAAYLRDKIKYLRGV
ncbi:MAG: excinuclease ABC subunit UvrB [Oscillospiraceae bacterium]|nr:excinuclease ABC subunit UvrB [Oscillospiraceae bacterium]